MADLGRARSIGRQHGLHMIACRGRNKITALIGNNISDGFCVLAAQGLARQNHNAGINILRSNVRLNVGCIDNFTKRHAIDALLIKIGGEAYR